MPTELDLDALELPYYDGAGNDFFIYDARTLPPIVDFALVARYVCDRHGSFGGADGLLVIAPSEHPAADVRMQIFNADGSEPEMCGNGARCAVRYLLESGGERVVLDTAAGLVAGVVVNRDTPFTVAIDIGTPQFTAASLAFVADGIAPASEVVDFQIHIAGAEYVFDGVSFGNPHIVVFVGDVELIDIAGIGPKLERVPLFTHGTNVHFAQVLDRATLRVRHWERGAGATQACGTGAAAVAVAAMRKSLVDAAVRVLVPGGELGVVWNGASVELSGPATRHAVDAAS